ncbi:hypothetical protein FRC16_010737 [Serendipita sp. 398]|nr:hypothetical protein FRC16_010737 [Serendipita sp. 398]
MSPTTAMTGTFRAGAAPGGQNGTGPWLHPHDGTSRTTSSSHPFRSIRPERNEEAEEDQSVFTNHHQLLLMRLKPILTVEADLLKRLSMPDEDEPVRLDFNLTGMRQAAVNAAKSSNTKVSSGSGQVANVKSSSSTSLPSSSLSTVIPGKANEEARTSNEDEKRRISAESMNESFTETVAKRLKQQGRPRSRSSTDVVPSVTVAQHVDGISAHYPTQPTTTAYVSTSSPSLDKGMTSSNNGNGTSAVKTTEESSSPPPFTLGNVAAIGGVSVGNIIRRVSEGDAGSGVGRDDIVVPEFFVRSPNWKEKFWRWTRYDPTERWVNGRNTNKRSGEWDPWDDPSDPAHFIQACARDLNELWNDSVVQDYLAKKKYKLEHSPGFFLGDVDRIVSRGYVPTDDDILRARLKTIGVTEHQIRVNGIGSMSKDWLMYDVGGTRTQRSAWVPYFDSADAIIFIANLAAFDQTLAEDPAMNRLEDSLRMFRSLVSSPILKNVNIVLFLNKIDLLEVKLNSGIKISKYFGRYGDRPNTVESVIKYFHAKFCAIYEKFTPASSKRAFTVHQTSLTNAPSTRIILDAGVYSKLVCL